jgi:phenylacetate-CoA ligase
MMFSALGLRYHLWHRRDFSGKNLHLTAMKPGETGKRFKGWVLGHKSGPALQLNHALPANKLLQFLINEDPKYLQVHPSTLLEMIRLSEISGIKPKSLIEARVVSETLDPDLRAFCQRVWGIPITNNYSCEEMGIMALQCPEHEHLHVQSENCLIEVLGDDDIPCQPGEIGRTVITCLNNYASPLIRYEIGDMAEVGSPCSCGRGMPVLNKIAGRVRNLVVLPSGQKATPVIGQIGKELKDLPVRQIQYIQKSIELIDVKLVVTEPMNKDQENQIGDAFNDRIGHKFNYAYHYVDEIKKLPNGKFETFRCEVTH